MKTPWSGQRDLAGELVGHSARNIIPVSFKDSNVRSESVIGNNCDGSVAQSGP